MKHISKIVVALLSASMGTQTTIVADPCMKMELMGDTFRDYSANYGFSGDQIKKRAGRIEEDNCDAIDDDRDDLDTDDGINRAKEETLEERS